MVKQFLKPDWRKILLLVILSIIFLVLFKWNVSPGGGLIFLARGFPLPIQTLGGVNDSIIYPLVLINLVFWYLISCLIISIYDKRKKKHA